MISVIDKNRGKLSKNKKILRFRKFLLYNLNFLYYNRERGQEIINRSRYIISLGGFLLCHMLMKYSR